MPQNEIRYAVEVLEYHLKARKYKLKFIKFIYDCYTWNFQIYVQHAAKYAKVHSMKSLRTTGIEDIV